MISTPQELSSRWSNQEEWGMLNTPVEKKKGSYNYLLGKSEEKRTLRRARNTWKDNMKMDLK